MEIMDTEEKVLRPVRGLSAVDSRRAVSEDAAKYDECWLILDENNQPVDPNHPALSKVAVDLRFGYLVLRAPGMLRLDIPMDVIEDDPSVIETVMIEGVAANVVDEGAWAQEWFAQVLGQPVRLVKRV